MTDHKDHVADFAEGQEEAHVEPGNLMGDFAAGQESKPRAGTVQPKGDFAVGEEAAPADPTTLGGDFAAGQEKTPHT